jgi:PadR family transcriptional regulator, regulatory protein PadR
MMVLRTLSASPAYGYEIAKAIGRMSDDVLAVDHGSRASPPRKAGSLPESGISSTNRRARYYRLSPGERKRLLVEHSNWEQMAAAVSRVMRFV